MNYNYKNFSKISVEKGSKKSFFQNGDNKMYSTDNQGKSVIAKRLIRTLKKYIHDLSFKKC